jgi:hypothetical protein
MIQLKKRRTFLVSMGLFLSGCRWDFLKLPRSNTSVLAIPFTDLNQPNSQGLIFIDLKTRQTKQILTEFGIHNLVYDRSSHRWVGVNSYGNQILLIDADSHKTQALTVQIPDVLLSGHIDTLDDLDEFYLTGVINSSQQNVILSLRKNDFRAQILSTFTKSDPPIHDGKFDISTDVFHATFGQNLIQHNSKTSQTGLRKLALGFANSSVRHFSVKNEKFCIQSNEIETGTKFKYKNAEVVSVFKDRIQRAVLKTINPTLENLELLDFSFLPHSNQFAATHNHSNLLTIWNSDPLGHEATVEFPEILIRVFSSEKTSEIFVLAQTHLYQLNLSDRSFKPLPWSHQHLRSSFTYSHETLVNI